MHTLDYFAMRDRTAAVTAAAVTVNVTTEAAHVGSRGGVNIVLRLEMAEEWKAGAAPGDG
jgi:hypothetical protein